LIESRIARDPAYLQELVSCFSLVKSPKDVARHLGFDGHPALREVAGKHSTALVPVLASIIYRCSLDDLFDNKEQLAKYHTKQHYAKVAAAAKAVGGADRLVEEHVWKHAMIEHIRVFSDSDYMFEVPPGVLQIEGLTDFLDDADTSAAKRRRLASAEPVSSDCAGGSEVGSMAPSKVLFRVRDFQPSSKRLLRIAVGAGRALQRQHLAITIHEHISGLECVVSCEGISWRGGQYSESLALVTDISSAKDLEAGFQFSKALQGMHYWMKDILHKPRLQFPTSSAEGVTWDFHEYDKSGARKCLHPCVGRSHVVLACGSKR
jgi:hypothetical protein